MNSYIPFGNLKKQYEFLKPEIDKAVMRVLSSGWFILGKEVEGFENTFAQYCGAKYCVGAGNGMEALQIALMALEIGEGDEVITTPLSAAATSLAISHVGAMPVFADINPKTLNIDPDEIEKKITPKTKAILPVHLYGRVADMKRIMEIAHKNHLYVIEDVAQAHGAKFDGKKAGTFGNFGVFSFYPSKNLGAYGDAGGLITNDETLAKKARVIRDYGQDGRYNHVVIGLNSRLDEIEAAILSVKLSYLDTWNFLRKKIAEKYNSGLQGFPMILPKEEANHVWHLYVIQTDRRDLLQKYLDEHGIASQIHYPKVIYQQSAYHFLNIPKGYAPYAEEAAEKILSLPIYPELTEEETDYIIETIKNFFTHGARRI